MDENKIIDQLLGKEDVPQNDSDQVRNEDVSLYALLDEVANGRRLMSCLFHSSMQVGTKLSTTKLDVKCRQIQRDWTDEEKIITMNSGVLQLDGPVLFSWSHNAAPISRQKSVNTTLQPVSTRRENNKPKITTTSQLFDRASAEIDRCIKPNGKSWEVKERLEKNEPNETDTNKLSSWANSDFKVDPLQKFVAKELPKSKKKSDGDQAKKHKSKRKSFFGFWGHSGTKSSSKNKTDKSTEVQDEIDEDTEGNVSQSPDENITFNDRHTTQSKQESTSDQHVESRVCESSATDTERSDYDGIDQAPAHVSQQISSEPGIASIPSLTLGSFVPLQPKKKT